MANDCRMIANITNMNNTVEKLERNKYFRHQNHKKTLFKQIFFYYEPLTKFLFPNQ
jgi:ribosomal protein L33